MSVEPANLDASRAQEEWSRREVPEAATPQNRVFVDSSGRRARHADRFGYVTGSGSSLTYLPVSDSEATPSESSDSRSDQRSSKRQGLKSGAKQHPRSGTKGDRRSSSKSSQSGFEADGH